MQDMPANGKVECARGSAKLVHALMLERKARGEARVAPPGELKMLIDDVDPEHTGARIELGEPRRPLAGAAASVENVGLLGKRVPAKQRNFLRPNGAGLRVQVTHHGFVGHLLRLRVEVCHGTLPVSPLLCPTKIPRQEGLACRLSPRCARFDRARGIVDTSPANWQPSTDKLRMSSVAPIVHPMTSLDEDAWEDLLNFIEERRVIPIVGPELLLVDTDAGPRLLYDWIAEKLAGKLGVDTAQLPKPFTLNDVVCWFLAARGRREEAYTRLRSVLRDAGFRPPKALRQLAQITDFDLFVTTTFDPLLEQAIEVVAYSPNRVSDLASERENLQRPVVYHLMGRLSASPTYVISDEDTLEFMCSLQSEHLTPEKLFHELEHNHLLLIGSSFTNWLARFFLRMAKRHRLSDPRDVGEILADSHSGKDGRLMSFLQQVSVRTRVYGGAEEFVDELHRRWSVRHKPGKVIDFAAAPQRFMPPEREMPDNAVFV